MSEHLKILGREWNPALDHILTGDAARGVEDKPWLRVMGEGAAQHPLTILQLHGERMVVRRPAVVDAGTAADGKTPVAPHVIIEADARRPVVPILDVVPVSDVLRKKAVVDDEI